MTKKKTDLTEQLIIQRNYLIFIAYHYLSMPMKDVKKIFGLSKQSIFNAIKESKELS